MPDDPITIHLSKPIKHGDEVITELTLDEPDLGSLMAMDDMKGDMAKTLAAICAMTGYPPSVIKQIKARDLRAISEKMDKLMGEESRETGEKRQPGSRTPSIGRPLN